MEIIKKDSLKKVAEGKYSKLVNTYSNKKELTEIVKTSSPEIFGLIKKNNERILSNTSLNFSLKPKTDTTKTILKDSVYTFTSFYPKKENAFIQLDGSLDTKTNKLSEKWKFNNINIDIVLTEKEDGLWNSYLNGPEYIKVNSMQVNSLPAKEYISKEDKIKSIIVYGGFGVRSKMNSISNLDGKDLTINGAVTIKNKVMIGVNLGTDKKVGTAVLFKF